MQDSTRTVLVVDDDRMIRRVVSMLLRDEDHRVLTAPNLSGARIALACAKIDLICCDFNLGGGETGLQLLKEIQRLPETTRPGFILMSGNALSEINPSPHHQFDFIEKPFNAHHFREVVARRLGKLRSLRMSA